MEDLLLSGYLLFAMPSLVKIWIERGRDLPVMDHNPTNAAPRPAFQISNADSSSSGTDAYVEIKLDEQSQRTKTCRRSLDPIWNEEFRFEVLDDSILQDAPVEVKCMDQVHCYPLSLYVYRLSICVYRLFLHVYRHCE